MEQRSKLLATVLRKIGHAIVRLLRQRGKDQVLCLFGVHSLKLKEHRTKVTRLRGVGCHHCEFKLWL